MFYFYLSVYYIVLFVDQINFMFESWFDNRCNYFFYLFFFLCFFSLIRLLNPLYTLIVFIFTYLDLSTFEVKLRDAVLFIILVWSIIKVAALESISPMALPFTMVIISFILYATRRPISTKGMLLSPKVVAFVTSAAFQL